MNPPAPIGSGPGQKRGYPVGGGIRHVIHLVTVADLVLRCSCPCPPVLSFSGPTGA